MSDDLTISSVEATLVVVPLRRSVGTSAMRIAEAPLILFDLHTDQEITGRAYIFCYREAAGHAATAIAREASEVLAGTSASPAEVRRRLRQYFRLLGARGVVAMVMAGIDVACWDALAVSSDLPLTRLLGGELRPIPAYDSNGLGLIPANEVATEALELADGGARGIKIRLGRDDQREDLAAVRAARSALPDEIELFGDFNQALTPAQARERCRQLDDEGLGWIEEPVRHDDLATLANLAAMLRTPLQMGENFVGVRPMLETLQRKASDFVMPDLERIGGVSGWLDAASVADAFDVECSSHLFHEVSCHLLAVTPTCHWIEYVDWADAVVAEPLRIVDGCINPPDRPGHGMTWDPQAVERFRRGLA